jgi:endonuclease/exonuclease/phosphatase family metal-dependent hydrolase
MIYSAHLHPSDDAIRAREVDEVLKVIAADRRPGREFILQGDLNHEPIQVEYGRWTGAGLTDAWTAKGVEQRNTIKSTFPNRTVDYIWLSPGLAARLIRCRVLFTGAFRTNPLDERSFALSDHVPVLAELVPP